MIECNDFDHAAQWVHERIPGQMAGVMHESELQQAFGALALAAKDANSTFLIVDLFPGVALDVLYVHDIEGVDGNKQATQNSASALTPGLSAQALTAIGTAVDHEMNTSGSDMVRYRIDGAEIIVSRPSVRSLVLQATGTMLLTKQ